MTDVSPIALLVIPLVAFAAMRRDRAVYFLVASVPLFGVTAFVAIGHQFRVPELAMFALGFNQLGRSIRTTELPLPRSPGLLWLFAFLCLALLSLVSVAFRPATVLTHPYNLGLDAMRLVPLELSVTNVTQFFLRLFTVLSIYLLAINLTSRTIRVAVRGLVYGGLLAGIVGVAFQVLVFADVAWISELFGRLLDMQAVRRAPSVGLVPRMYTLVGEPGHTAQLFLFLAAMLVGFAITPFESDVFSETELRVLLPVMVVLTLLTTSSTAYGGLAILGGVSVLGAILYQNDSGTRLLTGYAMGGVVVVGLLSVLVAFTWFNEFVAFQIEKLLFRGGSGIVRLAYFQLSVDLLSTRPLLGLGTGSYYSTSLAGTLLVENGLLGFGAFLGANLLVYRSAAGWMNAEHHGTAALGMALFVGGLTHFLTSLVAKSVTTLLTPWFWLSLALPIALCARANWNQAVTTDSVYGSTGEPDHVSTVHEGTQ